MKVSVAIATYNGEKYIYEQLDSLYNQLRQPDEVIICDDGSSDKTVQIVMQFIEGKNIGDKWKIKINKENKGYSRNFIECACMTTGDVIFFCDQDDIWHKEKISEMMKVYEQNDRVKALTCTYGLIDSVGNRINSILNRLEQGRGRLRSISFSEQMRRNSSCGMILSVKKRFFEQIVPSIVENNMCFDLPIGAFAAANNGYYKLEVVLAYRRIHENNVSSPKITIKERIRCVDYHIKGRKERIKNMEKYLELLMDTLDSNTKRQLEKAIAILKKSCANLEQRKILPLILDLFHFNPMISKPISVVNLLCAIWGKYN